MGVGSYHVTLPPSEGEYFRSQLNYNHSCLRFIKRGTASLCFRIKTPYTVLKAPQSAAVHIKITKIEYIVRWIDRGLEQKKKVITENNRTKSHIKYITCWLRYKKNPHKGIFQWTNHFK